MTAAAAADTVLPRDARFPPCLLSPDITCRSYMARPKSIVKNKMLRATVAKAANSSVACPDSLAKVLLPSELRWCNDAMRISESL